MFYVITHLAGFGTRNEGSLTLEFREKQLPQRENFLLQGPHERLLYLVPTAPLRRRQIAAADCSHFSQSMQG
jgi:hypothetical protein